MRELLAELTGALDQKRDCVYCSVIETRGSTPQKAGAAMLVFPDGSQCGTLGGGCVEAEVKQRALLLLSQQEPAPPRLLSFCLDDNYGWDDGLICGGRMTILADPCPFSAANEQSPVAARRQKLLAYYRQLRRLLEEGRGATEAVVMNAQQAGAPVGSRYLFDAVGNLVEQIAPGPVPDPVLRDLVPILQRPLPYVSHGVSYLPFRARITLLIVGGGHVGLAVARLAAEVDFDIWVLDDRDRYANRERFPMAHRHLVGDIGSVLKELARKDINPSIYAIIVTRGHAHDEEALYHLAAANAGYVGMIGSKRKIKLIYEDLLARGIPQLALDRVYAPLGFAIGSQTVGEIAISVVAELIACRNLGTSRSEGRKKIERKNS